MKCADSEIILVNCVGNLHAAEERVVFLCMFRISSASLFEMFVVRVDV
jgi:hypothetical protein